MVVILPARIQQSNDSEPRSNPQKLVRARYFKTRIHHIEFHSALPRSQPLAVPQSCAYDSNVTCPHHLRYQSRSMKLLHLRRHLRQFEPLAATRAAQIAVMNFQPSGTSDDHSSNKHPHSEQWLFVMAGSGEAAIGKSRASLRRVKLKQHSLLVIEKGEMHQIVNTGRKLLRTINFYVPPAYNRKGEALKKTTK